MIATDRTLEMRLVFIGLVLTTNPPLRQPPIATFPQSRGAKLRRDKRPATARSARTNEH